MKRPFLVLVLIGSLVSTSSVAAQMGGNEPGGITVTGTGLVSAPADSVTVEFVISDLSAMYSGMPMTPQAEATPEAQIPALISPVVDALSGIDGVGDVTVALPPATNPYGGPVPLARITLTVANPAAEQLLSIVTEAVVIAEIEQLAVSSVGAMFTVSDCASLDRAARQAALDDARAKAEVQADLIGVSLGDIVSLADDMYGYGTGTPSSGCEPEVPGMTYFGDPFSGATLPPFDPTRDAPEVQVLRMARVTFAFAVGDATPAA